MNIRVLREAGGLGDIVRILPAIRGLREKYPGAAIHVFVPPEYACLVERALQPDGAPGDRVIATPPNRRPRLAKPDEALYPYLRTGTRYDMTVDLYCPAFRHEADMKGEVWNDRIELFCKAADAWPREMRPNLPLTEEERGAARSLLDERNTSRKRGCIALQPFSTDPSRDWPAQHWRELADQLMRRGYGVFVLDSFAGRVREFQCPKLCGLPLLELAAVLNVVDLLIGPDSGLAHLSAAAGGRALGLTASQSGAVLYRHYPHHSYVQPQAVSVAVQSAIPNLQSAIDCRWPCYWARPEECARLKLKAAGRTCPRLAELSVREVLDAAEQILHHGDARAAMASVPFGEPPTDFQAVRCVAAIIPPRTRILDVDGVFGQALQHHGARHDWRLEACRALPIPAFDRTEQTAVMLATPASSRGDSLYGSCADWLSELFRVLRVGGRLVADSRLRPLTEAMGFRTRKTHGAVILCEKSDTWPKRHHLVEKG